MPSSRKFFHARHPSNIITRKSLALVLSLLIGFTGLLLFSIVVFRQDITTALYDKPLSVSVLWDQSSGGLVSGGVHKRHKVMGFVGIQTGFASVGRRRALRKTWFPSDHQRLQRLEESTGLAFRFIIGKTHDRSKMAALKKEVEEFDDFVLLDIDEAYSKLPYKTLAFFKAAYALFDSDFYVKADDDIYLRPDRLSLLLAKERRHTQTYIGCMKKGPVFTDPKLKWHEPLGYMLGKEYFLHAYGPIYALSADVVASLVALRNNSFRMFSNEDVTIGAWMLAMNVTHENNRQLCQPECTATSIAVWDIPKCSGLCNPEKKMLELHQTKICANSPTLVSNE
ncbi:putative galactosylxylosylprotein 3-beta-galactosyltransferase [Helianthus annuus]|nr:putative galactosylxylosylprotein 3-beta-galactosyltransferase [Helianthus annuus]